ncbi:hypothetical protein H2203_003407 [Taxawa tesnikishii (nom. ined.)]|nr:hypothetical protein H2203_003407 [Dothideales sp. JES 119]
MAQAPPAVAELFSLAGKTAVVTGGTSGLGLAMAVALAEAGANVVSIQRPHRAQVSELQSKVEHAERTFTQIDLQGDLGKGIEADILLNCAGIQRRGKVEELEDQDIDDVFAVNLKATYVAAQEFGKRLLEKGRPGKIINIGSITCFVGGTNISPYAAAKGGVLQMTKAFSNEWASKGIQVNAICPGYFQTHLTEQYATDPKYKGFYDYVVDRTPAAKWGDPSDLRGAVIFWRVRRATSLVGRP